MFHHLVFEKSCTIPNQAPTWQFANAENHKNSKLQSHGVWMFFLASVFSTASRANEGLKSDTTFLQQAVQFAGSSFQDGATGMPVVLNGNRSTAGCDVPDDGAPNRHG